jgi:hypothetical protein
MLHTVAPASDTLAHSRKTRRLRAADIPRFTLFGLALAVVLLAMSAFSSARKSSADDESLIAAHWMVRVLAGEQPPQGVAESSRAPGYSLVVAMLAQVTPQTEAALACWGKGQRTCRVMSAPFLVVAQILAVIAILLLSFRLASNLSGDAGIALIAAILTYMSMRLGDFAGMLRPYVWYQLFLMLYLVLLTQPHAQRFCLREVGAGIALAFAIQFEPVSVILVPFTVLLLVFRRAGNAGRSRFATVAAVAFLISATAAAVGLLWAAGVLSYNSTSFARAIAFALSERMAFVGINSSTSLAMIVTMVPTFGDLAALMLPASEIKRMAIGSLPGSLVYEGTAQLLPDALARGGGTGFGAIAVLLKDRLIDQPLAFLISIPPMIARGLFAGSGIIGLIGLLHVRSMLSLARAEDRLHAHLLVVVPAVALLLANALFTANPFWLNPVLPFVYAYAIVYVAGGW